MEIKNIKKLQQADNWIFDLDNTLYPATCDLFPQISKKIGEFICNHLDVAHAEAKDIQYKYFKNHGTTLNGLMLHHDIDPKLFLDYVHDIDYSPIDVNEILNNALGKLTARKYIFTNGSVSHADKVLDKLGIAHHFTKIFDIVAADYIPKPQAPPYEKFISINDIDPKAAVMVEDMAKNLKQPSRMGMQTIWIKTDIEWAREGCDDVHIDHVVDDISSWLAQVTQ